jgi:hypothetical protein
MSDDLYLAHFEKAQIPLINSWLAYRGMSEENPELIPEIGFIAYKEGIPVCAGFLRKCEGKIGILDSLVTNPKVNLFTRHLAINKIVRRVIQAARDQGYLKVLAFSTDKGTIKRSVWHEFEEKPHTLLSLDLSE